MPCLLLNVARRRFWGQGKAACTFPEVLPDPTLYKYTRLALVAHPTLTEVSVVGKTRELFQGFGRSMTCE